MSTHYWSEEGYGCYTCYMTPTNESFIKVLKESKLMEEFKDYVVNDLEICSDKEFDENKISVTNTGYVSYEDNDLNEEHPWDSVCGYSPLAFFILTAAINNEIKALTKEECSVYFSYNGEECEGAVIYTPTYPWYLKQHNIELHSEEEYKAIYMKWLEMFGYDKEKCTHPWDRCAVEQWG